MSIDRIIFIILCVFLIGVALGMSQRLTEIEERIEALELGEESHNIRLDRLEYKELLWIVNNKARG